MRPYLLCVFLLLVRPGWTAEPLRVVTGTTVVQDLVLQIGGDRVRSTCLLQPGGDPHGYQPVPEDVKRLAKAQLVVINGLGFEGWFEGLAKEAGYRGTVVVASATVEPLAMEESDHPAHPGHEHHTAQDPHAYNSLQGGMRYAEVIIDALAKADPAGAAEYRTRGKTYLGELRQLDAWAKKAIAAIPAGQRKIVTHHDALAYFARDYGFEIKAPGTALEDSQPSAKDIADLVTFIRAQGVKGVFLEFAKNDKIISQVADEAQVKIGAGLYLDGTGAPGTPAATYAGMFRVNVEAIVAALK